MRHLPIPPWETHPTRPFLRMHPPPLGVMDQPSEIPTHPRPYPRTEYGKKNAGYGIVTLAVRGLTGQSFG